MDCVIRDPLYIIFLQCCCQSTLNNLAIYWICVNTLRPRQNGRHFADDTFKYIFLNENSMISAKISLMFVPKGPINNIPALVQIMAWRRPGDKPLSEPMLNSLLTHICVTRPQWVNNKLFIRSYQLSVYSILQLQIGFQLSLDFRIPMFTTLTNHILPNYHKWAILMIGFILQSKTAPTA